MPKTQGPSGSFAGAEKRVEAAKLEARALAVQDYAARISAALDQFESTADWTTFLTTAQRHWEKLTKDLSLVASPTG